MIATTSFAENISPVPSLSDCVIHDVQLPHPSRIRPCHLFGLTFVFSAALTTDRSRSWIRLSRRSPSYATTFSAHLNSSQLKKFFIDRHVSRACTTPSSFPDVGSNACHPVGVRTSTHACACDCRTM